MKVIRNSHAAKKMTQKPGRGFKGQSRRQAENLILSGWQGSDEDEDVNIDSSDDENAFSTQKWKSVSSTSSLLRARLAEEDSSSLKARHTEELTIDGDRPVSSPPSEKLGPEPDRPAMKVKSSDARRFRKELTANKSGAKLATIPRALSDSPPTRGSPGRDRKDRRKDARAEDAAEEIPPGEPPDMENKLFSLKESQSRSVGTGYKCDQGEPGSMGEVRRRVSRDTKDPRDFDDEARKKRRYRELEQAQLIADRRLTLRDRAELRQRDGGSRREDSTQSNYVGRRPRMTGVSIPREIGAVVRSRNGGELVPAVLGMEDISETEMLPKQVNKKAKMPEKDAEIAKKASGTRSSRSIEKSTGEDSSAQQDLGDSKCPRNNSRNKQESLFLCGAEAIDKAEDSVCNNASGGMNVLKPPDRRSTDGDSADGVTEVKKTTAVEETDLSCKEWFVQKTEAAAHDTLIVSKETQPSCEEASKREDKRSFCTAGLEESSEACVPVNTNVGSKPEKGGSENSMQKRGGSADCTGLRVADIDKTRNRSESQISGDTVEDRESRCQLPLEKSAMDHSEGVSRPTVAGVKPDMNVTGKVGDCPRIARTDTAGPELEKRSDSSGRGYDARREGSAVCSLEQVGDIRLTNERSDRCCDASGCKVTYHLQCADPSMTEVPEGKWYCPSCAQKRLSFGVYASLQAVESIWDVRDCTCPSCSGCTYKDIKNDAGKSSGIVDESGDRTRVVDLLVDGEKSTGIVEDSPSPCTSQRVTRRKYMELEVRRESEKQKTDAVVSAEAMGESAEDLPKGCDKQYFVKWKNLSHLHNTWVAESELKKAAPKMLEIFKRRLETDNLNQARIRWKPIWQVPQRFLTKRLNAPPRRPGGGRGRGYLGMDARLEWFVKWQDLGYEHCTWEQVHSGVLDCEISKKLESSYDKWCEAARRRSHPARIEEVLRIREAKYKVLDEQPDWLQGCKLNSLQLEELNVLRERWHHHRNALLVREGDQERTTTAVAFLLSLIEEYGVFKPILVVVPGTGFQMWELELQRYAERVNTVVYAGTPAGRSVIQRHELNPSERPIKFQIVLTTFDIAISDHDHLGRFEWEALILDEGHRSRLMKSCRHLQFLAPYRLILLSDFSKCTPWEMQQFLVYLEPGNNSVESELQSQLEELDEDSQRAFLRGKLTEKMVGDDSSLETTPVEFNEHWIAGIMTPIQVHLYCTELVKHYNLLHNGRMRADQNLGSIYGLTGTLRNVCNHPFLVDSSLQEDLLSILKPPQSLVEAGIQQCGKFKTLQLMLTYLHAKGRRVLLVCQTDMLCYYFDDYMRQMFGAESYECVFKGSEIVKIQAIQRFSAEDSTRFVFILKRNTAGVSFQLRETDAVIVYDSDWNPANDLQYIQKVVYKVRGQLDVYRLYTPFSVEEAAIAYSLRRRSELQSGIKVLTAKYCQQIIKWKVKELFELNDAHSMGASEKELMAEVLEGFSETSPNGTLNKILDGGGKAEAESFNEEVPEEEGEALKEFWTSLLKERYAGLQVEELTNAGKGLRSRKRVHYSEDALALASYAAGNEEEVKKKRRKSQGSELVDRGSPRANIMHSSLKTSLGTLMDSSSADEVVPAKSVAKDAEISDTASQATVEGTSATLPENTATGSELPRQGVQKETESGGPALGKQEIVQPVAQGKVSAKCASGVISASNEEGRKTRSEQQQIMLGLWRPEVTRICKTLRLLEKVATYADQLLVHCMKSYRMPKDPKDLVLQVQIALCVVAAERFSQEIDHLTTLSEVEESMDVKLKRESWNDNYHKIVSCCKGYPLPEPPEEKLRSQARSVAFVSGATAKSKSTDEDSSPQRPVGQAKEFSDQLVQQPKAAAGDSHADFISQVPENRQPHQNADKLPALQTTECRIGGSPDDHSKALIDRRVVEPKTTAADSHADQSSEVPENLEPLPDVDKLPPLQTPECLRANPVDLANDLPDHRVQQPESAAAENSPDQRQAAEKDQELDTQTETNVPRTVASSIEDASGVNDPGPLSELENTVVSENLQNAFSRSNKQQLLEKLKTERHEINSVVVYQQTQEMNEFYRSNNAEKEGMLRRNEEVTADVMRNVTDPEQRAILLQGQMDTHSENVRKFDLHFKEQHEMLVKTQRAIRDEIHSVYSELLQQVGNGSSRSLYDEAQDILAKMGVKSVAEAQSILRAVGDEARRKKAPVAVPQGPVERVSSQVGRNLTGVQAPVTCESSRPIQRMCQPQSVSQVAAGTQPQPSHVPQMAQLPSPHPSARTEIQSAQPVQLSYPSSSQLQQVAPTPSRMSQSTHSTGSSHSAQPNNSSVQARDVHHPLPPRPTTLPRQNYVAAQENSESPRQRQNVSSVHVSVADSMPSQLLHNVGRTHSLQPSVPSHQQRTIQARQHATEQQRNVPIRRQQATTIPHQQPGWHSSSTGQDHPTNTRPHPQQQLSSSSPGVAVSTNTNAHVNHRPTLNSVAHFGPAAVTLLPPIPQNMLGPDPVLQEEARLKKEKENLRVAYEKKASEIKKKFGEELEDARRKYVAMVAELKRKFEGMLEETTQHWHRQTSVVHQNHLKARRSRLLAEALRNRAMFDIVYQPRHAVQQGDESGSASGQMRSGQSVASYTGPAGRSYVQPAQQSVQSVLPMRQIAAFGNEPMISAGSGQSINASPPAGRVTIPPFHMNSSAPARNVGAPQREGSGRSVQGVLSPVVAIPPAFASSGLALQHTHRSSLVPTEDVQGQRTELSCAGIQQAGTPVQSSGVSTEPGSVLAGGLWQSSSRPGSWQNGVAVTQSVTLDSLPGRITGEATLNRVGTGSPALSASNPNVSSSGSVQPAFDNSHGQLWTSQNRLNNNVHPTTAQQRRSWTSEWTGNTAPPATASRIGSQSADILTEACSVPVASNNAATERLPPPALVANNEASTNSGTPALVSVNQPECIVARAQVFDLDWSGVPLPDSSPNTPLPASASREPNNVGAGESLAGGLGEGLTDRPDDDSRADVPIIYLSDDD